MFASRIISLQLNYRVSYSDRNKIMAAFCMSLRASRSGSLGHDHAQDLGPFETLYVDLLRKSALRIYPHTLQYILKSKRNQETQQIMFFLKYADSYASKPTATDHFEIGCT